MKFLNRYVQGPLLDSVKKYSHKVIEDVILEKGMIKFELPDELIALCRVTGDSIHLIIINEQDDGELYENYFPFEFSMSADSDAKALVDLMLDKLYDEVL